MCCGCKTGTGHKCKSEQQNCVASNAKKENLATLIQEWSPGVISA